MAKAKSTSRRAGSSASRRRSAATGNSAGRATDAIALLKRDHREVDALVKQFEKARSGSKERLAERICAALTVHAQIEEEIFYPAARESLRASDEDLVDEAAVEHASVKDLIRQIEASSEGDDLYDAKVTVLGEYVRHHVKEEETELFPKIRKSSLDTREIGARMAARKAELEEGSGLRGRRTASLSARAQTSAKGLVASVAKVAGRLRGE
jgi:hemerythrin superfamily protein